MKKLILLITILQISSLTLLSQAISTNAEIYNFDIGNEFHYFEEMGGNGSATNTESNVSIIGKYYSSDNDTLFYIRDITTRTISSSVPTPVYGYIIDTINYTNLNSPVNNGIIDSTYNDLNKYNGRRINRDTNSIYDLYVDSLGKVLDNIFFNNTTLAHHSIKLVYYRKGSEVWGTPIPLVIKSRNTYLFNINIYPNPASNNLYFYLEKKINEDVLLSIYNSLGELVKQEQLTAYSNEYRVNIGELSKGIYFVKFTSNTQPVYSSKFIKE